MTAINVKEVFEPTEFSFIEAQKIDAEAAAKRIKITRQAIKEYHRQINDTNTAGMPNELKVQYDNALKSMLSIIALEHKLVGEGE